MRSDKPFTNKTFTKRVDREAGRHRTLRSPKAPAVCIHCGATYQNKRWIAATETPIDMRHQLVTSCPGCKQKDSLTPRGFVLADGAFVPAHEDEITRLLQNEVARAAEDNPLGKLMSFRAENASLMMTTTTEHLAQRLGHALEKAFGGEVKYDFSHENKLARVSWHRDV